MANLELKSYISRQLSEQAKILRLSAFDNAGNKLHKRYFYYSLKKHIDNFLETQGEPRWIIIPGLRGVGKTTVLSQIFFRYREMFGRRVLYVSLDEVVKKLGCNLFEVLDVYEELLSVGFSELKEDVLLLVDEVHFDPEWQFALKSLYDRSRRVFIISTGSSAINLNTTTDVARRSLIEKMYPLKFTEYVMLSDSMMGNKSGIDLFPKVEKEIAAALFESQNAQEALSELQKASDSVIRYWQNVDTRAIDRYLKFYSIPSVLANKEDSAIYANLNAVIDRIIEKDIPTLKSFTPEINSKIPALLLILAGSDTQSLQSLANELKDIEVKTLSTVFRVLEDSELLVRVYPFSLSAPKKVRLPSKYLFLASSLRAALLHLIDSRSIDILHRGKLLEDAVGMYLYRHFKNTIGWTISMMPAKKGRILSWTARLEGSWWKQVGTRELINKPSTHCEMPKEHMELLSAIRWSLARKIMFCSSPSNFFSCCKGVFSFQIFDFSPSPML
jgi:uncharacterized protein